MARRYAPGAVTAPPARSRLRPLLLKLGLLAVGATLAVELWLSLFAIRNGMFMGRALPPFETITNDVQREWLASVLAGQEVSQGIGTWDPEIGWVLLPGGTTAGGQSIAAGGMRGPRDYPEERTPGLLRLCCYGDSFTYGDEVADNAAYPFQLEEFAAAAGRPLEAINFGLPGGGTDQALLIHRRESPRFAPDVVAIGILLENIGRNVNRYRPRWSPNTGRPASKPRFVLDESGELQLLPNPPYDSRDDYIAAVASGEVAERSAEGDYWLGRPTLGPLRYLGIARVAGFVWAHLERQPKRLWSDPDGEPYRTSLALLERFHREALEGGAAAAPVLVFHTRDDLIEYVDTGERYWDGLLGDLDRLGIPYIDLAEPLADLVREHREDPSVGSVYVATDGHLDYAGNNRVAAAVWEWLEARPELWPRAGD